MPAGGADATFPSFSSATVQPTLPCKDTIVGPQTMYLALIVLRRGGRGSLYFQSPPPPASASSQFAKSLKHSLTGPE